MKKRTYISKNGPKASGPYSSAVIYGDVVYVSGTGPKNPKTDEFVRTSVADEARMAFENVDTVLKELGGSLNDALKVTLYLDDMKNYSVVNDIYKEYFGPDYPARTTIQAGALPNGIKVEVDVIAAYKGGKD